MRSRLCHTCRRRPHLKCVKLTGAVSEQLGRWTCPTCLRGGNNTDPVNNLTDDELSARLHHLVANWKKNIRVLARVPKGARVQAAEALTKLLDDVSDNNNITSWARLFGFSFGALRNPTRTPQSGQAKTSLATKIRAQINSYMDGNSLPDTVVNSNHRQGPRANSDESLGRRVASKLADFDIKGAVRIIASDNTFAGYGEDVTAGKNIHHPRRILTSHQPRTQQLRLSMPPKSKSWKDSSLFLQALLPVRTACALLTSLASSAGRRAYMARGFRQPLPESATL